MGSPFFLEANAHTTCMGACFRQRPKPIVSHIYMSRLSADCSAMFNSAGMDDDLAMPKIAFDLSLSQVMRNNKLYSNAEDCRHVLFASYKRKQIAAAGESSL